MNIRPQRSSYRLLGLVGNGQFGRVYCGVHRKTGQLVAIKYLHRHSLSTHAFLRELHCLLSLAHPNIVACHALEHSEDGRRLVLEYCAGGTLRSHMLNPLSPTDILNLMSDVLHGLAHAHQQGIVHCDIKPENILLSYHDGRWRAKISDFGIAKLVQEQPNRMGSGQTGSPAYMAPERFYRQYSPAADVYAIGVMLFELLVGQRPFTGTPAALQSAHLNQPVPEADQLSAPFKQLVAKALEKLPARRYPTATEMLTALKQIDPLSPDLVRSQPSEQITYTPYTGEPTHSLTQPVHHLQTLQTNAPIESLDAAGAANPMPATLMAHGSQLAVLQQQALTVTEPRLDSPVQGLYSTERGLVVATKHALWGGANHGALNLLNRWQAPTRVTVAPRQRWAAWIESGTQQLTIAQLPKFSAAAAAVGLGTPPAYLGTATAPLRRPLPPDLAVTQVLALDQGHIAVIGSAQAESRLLLWNRRGLYLTSLELGITLGQLTPMGQPHQWMAIDANAPQTVVFLTLKPLRMTRMRLDICPAFMLDLPWGYLFGDIEGRMLLLDRDFQSIGGIHGPAKITALTSVSAQTLLVATWQDGSPGYGALHQLDLQDFELDMIF